MEHYTKKDTQATAGSGSVQRLVRQFFVEWNYGGKWNRSQIDQDTLEEAIARCENDLSRHNTLMRVVEVETQTTETIHALPNALLGLKCQKCSGDLSLMSNDELACIKCKTVMAEVRKLLASQLREVRAELLKAFKFGSKTRFRVFYGQKKALRQFAKRINEMA